MTLENRHIFNRKYIFNWWIFHCHVRFQGGLIFLGYPPVNLDSWLEHGPGLKMYFLLKMGDIPAIAMLVYQEVTFQGRTSGHVHPKSSQRVPFSNKMDGICWDGAASLQRRSIMSQGFECLITKKVLPEEWSRSHLDKVQNGWRNDKINEIDNVLDMKPTQATASSRLFHHDV